MLSNDVPSLRRQFLRDGYCRIPHILDEEMRERLRVESSERWPHADTIDSDAYEIGEDGALYPPRRQHHAYGPVLGSVHADRDVVGLTRLLTGKTIVPAHGAAYWFYESDGHIGLHRDIGDCQFVLMIGAIGDADPITLYPHLVGVDPMELREIAAGPDDRLGEGIELSIPAGGAAFLAGSVVPHLRPARERTELVGVATLCYRSLL